MSVCVYICTCMSIRACCFATQTSLNDAWVHTNAGKNFAWLEAPARLPRMYTNCSLATQPTIACSAALQFAIRQLALR